MPNPIRDDLLVVDDTSFPYLFEQNVTIPIKSFNAIVRCNIYRPKTTKEVPVIMTYGPYGKDIHYKDFHEKSYSEVNSKHHSEHSSFETPDPRFWTANGYAVLRADEVGLGQSPGMLDTMSQRTSDAFADVIEWASEQPWSNGKVGLMGISYFAGSQWRVAARQPKGLAAIIPTDGMADYYRDRCRHGGILTGFLKWWYDRQVLSNQYGLAGKASRNWGPDTIEGDLPEAELAANRRDQTIDNAQHFYRDDPYYSSREYNLEDIVVPLLSLGNWGSIMIHLHGNYEGFRLASSEKKFLRMLTGRHDLPFYDDEHVEVMKSFLDAFLKGEDRGGWTDGSRPPVDLILRKGNVGYNNSEAEKAYKRRFEHEWPLARTKYTKFYLTADRQLVKSPPELHYGRVSYQALGNVNEPRFVSFHSEPLESETELTGYVVAHLNVSVSAYPGGTVPADLDLFLTLRHFGPDGNEIYYTGITGEPVPLSKGWQRLSLRKINKAHPRHREWLPHRDYFSTDVLPVIPGEIYPVDVEVWATNVIAEKGDSFVLEVASGDTQGSGLFGHDTPERYVVYASALEKIPIPN
ncbi:putative serine esterase [Cyphellophora attinorum]|uniref:Putative serine esterase n=1 Tax=Cyphellophora attinorum TaxID=1664694 RepID=A0A0N1GZI6_9EURO|nr:putative serine esterase [Phialophora attinorum]KPI36497.1 putative serine esterase [Phialophora attinorum]